MNILVINGSPKGQYSITLQSSLYLQELYKEHSFFVLDVGQKIRKYEKDITSALDEIKKADMIIFSYPVYTFIAPSQLHRFIELIKPHAQLLKDKYCAQITTSKHFYDVTAHRYIKDNCLDMGMRYLGGLSQDMEDLIKEKGQKELTAFFDLICWKKQNAIFEDIPNVEESFTPKLCTLKNTDNTKKPGDIVIVADIKEDDVSLSKMVDRFIESCIYPVRVINIREQRIDGGCLGCFGCAADGKCIYKDNFDEFLRTKIQTAQAIIYAYSISDHSMGARFKMYDDRQFCNGHRTVTMGQPVGYIVSGALSKEENLRTIMNARAQVGGNYLSGIASDEIDPERTVDELAKTVYYAVSNKLTQPSDFYGVGGMKIFRDLIYVMRGMMKADHKFYKAHGQYDFPQKQVGTIIKMQLVGLLISSKKIKSKMGNMMNEGMIAPYKKVIEEVKKRD